MGRNHRFLPPRLSALVAGELPRELAHIACPPCLVRAAVLPRSCASTLAWTAALVRAAMLARLRSRRRSRVRLPAPPCLPTGAAYARPCYRTRRLACRSSMRSPLPRRLSASSVLRRYRSRPCRYARSRRHACSPEHVCSEAPSRSPARAASASARCRGRVPAVLPDRRRARSLACWLFVASSAHKSCARAVCCSCSVGTNGEEASVGEDKINERENRAIFVTRRHLHCGY